MSVGSLTGRTIVVSEKHTLYESIDGERTFVPVASAAGWPVVGVQVLPSNARRAVAYLQGDAKSGFMPYATTTDAGATWRLHNDTARVPTALRYFGLHETRDDVLLATQFITKPCTLSCDDRTTGLHPNALVSVDFGESWQLLGEYAVALSFGRDDSLLLLDDPQKQGNWADCSNFAACRLLRVPFRRENGTTAVLIDDAVLVGIDVTAVSRAGSALFASHRDRWLNNTYLRVATDGSGEEWHDCLFPELDVHANGSSSDVWRYFSALAAPDNMLIVAVQDVSGGTGRIGGTLFVADVLAPHLFRSVLPRLAMSQASRLSAVVEASVMAGVNGTLFANQFQNDNFTCSRTMASFDYGASWQPTTALVNGGVYSMAIGPGVGMAFSAKVKCLDEPIPSNMTLVLTLDAGRSWRAVHESSSFTYELAARGAIWSIANASQSQELVSLSSDFGATWTTLNFSTPAIAGGIAIENIISTDYKGDSLLLYGIGVNLTGVLVSIAPATVTPACTAAQYVAWGDTVSCTLGAKTTMLRRMANESCMADARVEHADSTPCACGASDAACDVCACDGASNATCTRWRSRLATIVCAGRGNDSLYLPPSARRRLPGNVCAGGDNVDVTAVACPPLPPPTSRPSARPAPWDTTVAPETEPVSGGTIAGVVLGIVLVIAIAAGVLVYVLRRRLIRSRLPQLRRRLLGGDDHDRRRLSSDRPNKNSNRNDNNNDDNNDDDDDDAGTDDDSDKELLS